MKMTEFQVKRVLQTASAKAKSIAARVFGITDTSICERNSRLNIHKASIGLVTVSVLSSAAFGVSVDSAMAFTLNNGSGEGTLRLDVDGFGSFGSGVAISQNNNPGGTGDAFYTPLGSANEAGTTFESGIGIRFSNVPNTFFMTTGAIGTLPLGFPVPSVSGTPTQATSSFTFNSIRFDLEQVLTDLIDDTGNRSGTNLTQTYAITNTSSEDTSFNVVRYFDGNLLFENPNNPGVSSLDGGGRLPGGQRLETLFLTSEATDSADVSTNFVGITAEGGVSPTSGRYEVSEVSGLIGRIVNGVPLNDTVTLDSNSNGFTDQSRNLALGLSNQFSLAPNETTIYTTQTIFGTGAPSGSQPVPEPLTILGSLAAGGFGLALRRKYKNQQKVNV
jgi:hypothetical protein